MRAAAGTRPCCYAAAVIVILCAPSIRLDRETGRGEPAGLGARIALAVAAAGAPVQLAGRIGDDPAGDEVLLALGRAGVRHDAVLRDPDRATPLAPPLPDAPLDVSAVTSALLGEEVASPGGDDRPARPAPVLAAADVALCLSYLRDFGVVVAADPLDGAGRAAAVAAAAFAGARTVMIDPTGSGEANEPLDVPSGVTVLDSPSEDPEDDFACLVARYASALDRGEEASTAFRAALAGAGWEAVGSES